MEFPNITDLSHELLCQILKYLPLREILSVAMLCKKMATAVDMHLRLCKSIDFCQDAICGYMPSTITDDHLLILFKKCPHLETVYGLHPVKIERRRLRKRSALTIPGIIEALNLCFHLKAVETSDLRLFEAIMQLLPHIEIIGHFQNRDGLFPPQASQRLKLQPYPRISSLHLIGVEVPELTAMPHLQHLHLQCVRFTKLQPFRAFLAQNLKSFVMKHCIGPSVPQRYLSLIIALSSSPNLNHLELVRVPLLNGLFQRAVEDSYRHNGFVNLRTLVISGCKGVLEADLGHLMIVSSKNLETLFIQPSLTKDSLFVSLSYAQCVFPRLQNLHLGYIDTLNSSGEWSNDALLSLGLAEVPDTPSSITDSGMKVISELFPHIKTMSVSNCPHLMIMYHWMSAEDNEAWSRLTDLTLQKCHCLQLSSFAVFISFLSNIEVVILNDMFREPPKGCSHVGLSAGTGLGMSSAVVSNQDEHIAVQGHHQDFEHPGDEENEENEREFVDVENEEPHFMVLQRDFFDGEEEEEDDEGADAVVEDQDPAVILEHQNIEEHGNAENCVNDNSLQIKEKTLMKENNACDDEPSSSVEDKILHTPSRAAPSDVKTVNAHKENYQKIYPSKSSLPSMKSVHVQCDTLSEDCPQSTNSETSKTNSFHSNDMSNDSYKSDDDVKICVCSKLSDYNYDTDYDPYKPSTSKAGSHLDYCAPCDRKSFKTSDSEMGHFDELDKASKQSKNSLEQKIFKTEFVNPDSDESSARSNSCLKLNVDLPSGTENSSVLSDFPGNSPTSQNCFSIRNSSLNEACKPCIVLVGKLDYPDDSADNSSVILDHERSSSQIDAPTLISYNSLEKEKKLLSESDVDECCSPGGVKHSYFASGDIKMSPDNPSFNDSLKHDNEILVQHIENSVKEANSLDNKDGSDDMIFEGLERIDNVYNSEFLENCGKCVELRGDTSLQIGEDISKICNFLADKEKDSLNNVPTESDEFSKKCKNLSHESTSVKEDSYVPKENEKFHDPVVKTESNYSHWPDSSSFVTNEKRKQDILNINAVKQNHPLNYEVPVPCTEICEHIVPHDEKASDLKDPCTTSGNKMSENKLPLKGEVSCDIEPNKNILNVKTQEIFEKDIHASHTDDISSENIRSVQKTVSDINTEEKEVTSGFNSFGKNKMQDEELCQTFKKSRIEYSDSLIEKQNTNSVVTLPEANSVIDNSKNSISIIDKSTGISESSSEIHSKHLNMDETFQPTVSGKINDYSESCGTSTRSVKSSNPVNHKNNETFDIQTRKCTNSYSNTNKENEKTEHNISGFQSAKRTLKDKNQTQENFEAESESSEPVAKRLRTCEDHSSNDDDDSKYYILVSGMTVDIVNSLTEESHRLPTCSVLLTKCNNECSTSRKGQKSFNSSLNCNPCLASTSKDESQCQSFTETCKLHTGVKCSLKCDVNYRKVKKRYPVRTKTRQRNSDKIEDGLKCCKEEFKKDCDCSRKSSFKHTNMCDHHSCGSSSLKVRKERLKIANSCAAVIIKNQTDKENLLNLSVDSQNYVENNDVNLSGNSEYSNQMVIKKEAEEVMSNSSEKYSSGHHNNSMHAKNDTSGSAEVNITHNGRRTRKKRIPLSQKQNRKLPKNSVSKPEQLNKHTRNSSKKIPTVPTVCLISQGTQANSADIRRSVRRIRRATAQARRTMSSVRVSRNSTHSNKISAKTLNKKPVNMNPRPEMQDKATSTSDPLLEDDAVQTLQLTSKTLLSFTVVSCGISDIIIDHCSKLFHIEVQACRILKKFHLDYCPAMKRLNISQCPKLSICALASPVMAIEPDSYLLVSYEPCMQGYHPGEGEKAILSRATLDQNVLICHDISAISHEGFQAMFKEKLIVWLRYMSKVHSVLKQISKNTLKKIENPDVSEYPWSHDLRRIHGKYDYLPSTDFCHSDGRYELVTNNPIFCDVFETHQLVTGFPAIDDCDAPKNISRISHEARVKCSTMDKKFIGFYIPVTENNQINF